MNTTIKEKTNRRKRIESTGRRIYHRLVVSIVIALAVSVTAVVITAMVDTELWMQAALSATTVALLCTAAAVWLAWRIHTHPEQSMHSWIITLYIHFISVIAVGLYFTIKLHFHPVPAILVGFLPAMVFVYANAWIVGALTIAPNSLINTVPPHLKNAGLAPRLGGCFAPYQSEDPS